MNHRTGTARSSTKRRRMLAAFTAAAVAATVAPLLGTGPAAAATSCTDTFRVRDLTMYVCWEWDWVGSALYWRPSALRIRPTDSGKSYYVLVLTNSWKNPSSVYLGEKRGPANWGVPSTYDDWTMYWQTESTTTRIARPGPDGDCTALVRHDAVLIDDAPSVRVLRFEGAC
jgi:hypothetical protein